MFYLDYSMAFDIDFSAKGQLKLHTRKFLLYPQKWEDREKHISQKLSWKFIKFDEKNRDKVPDEKGIYCLVVKPKAPNFFETRYLFYVGQTKRTLRIRYTEYIRDQQGKGKPRHKIYELLKLYANCIYFYFSIVSIDEDIDDIERKLIDTFIPWANSDIPIARVKAEYKSIYE